MNNLITKYFEKLKTPKFFVFIGIAGILLIFLSSVFPVKKAQNTKCNNSYVSADDYCSKMQRNVEKITSSITGNSNVKVIITLESGIKYNYANINEDSTQKKSENDSESASRELKQSYITVKSSDGGEEALLITEEMPQVRGVAIVCEGGDDPNINEKIKYAVMAALNITSKRVYVAGGNFR